jgi:type VI secretion system secreted protein VgrG
MLEEAGITYHFSDDDRESSRLVFADALHSEKPREGGPIRYVDHPSDAAQREYVTDVHLTREVRPGKVVLEDMFFRGRPDVRLMGEARIEGAEARLEQYRYAPGAFVVEGGKGGETPMADDKGVARADERAGQDLAERALAALRGPRRVVSFRTNVLGLRPGVLLSMENNPRSELGSSRRLLVTEQQFEGTNDGE